MVEKGMDKLKKLMQFGRDGMYEWLKQIEWADNSDGEYTKRCPECEGRAPSSMHPAEEWITARIPGEYSGHSTECYIHLMLQILEAEHGQRS